jgi:hypothetical protein
MGLVPMGLVRINLIEQYIGSEFGLELVSRGVRRCIQQHFENAVECNA